MIEGYTGNGNGSVVVLETFRHSVHMKTFVTTFCSIYIEFGVKISQTDL